ncbi:hypothetical protein DFH08DRAFT_347333 [Mycena albidolilacea]|uniref:Protein kinase domain-containing protein n=1 Tax=Mycena albidolilacea TaxID=1033008 RepID=A0AAD6ZJN9_9AGAR|nr:hypothetical protein DFH08DRAFT_347333 [Mycena albidolilacea]
MARRLMQKLSEARDQLPTSLFIIGVHDPDEHPTFAGGFAHVYRVSYDSKHVAFKRIRTFTPDSTNPKRMQLCKKALVWQGLRHASILPFLGIDRHTFPSSLCMVSPWFEARDDFEVSQRSRTGGHSSPHLRDCPGSPLPAL